MIPVTVADPEAACVAILSAVFGSGVASTSYPSAKLIDTAVRLQVDLEAGSVDDYPVTERAQVRITAHAAPGKRTAVKALADDARRALVSAPGSATVAGIWPAGARSGVSADPTTGNLMCWFLVRVDLKASLAS